MIKIVITTLAFLSLLLNVAAWQQCIPGSCSDIQEVCSSSGPCVNETAAQHIDERISLFNSINPNKSASVFLAILLLSTLFQDYELFFRNLFDTKLAVRFRQLRHTYVRLNNYLLELFLKGIINPKIYSLAV